MAGSTVRKRRSRQARKLLTDAGQLLIQAFAQAAAAAAYEAPDYARLIVAFGDAHAAGDRPAMLAALRGMEAWVEGRKRLPKSVQLLITMGGIAPRGTFGFSALPGRKTRPKKPGGPEPRSGKR